MTARKTLFALFAFTGLAAGTVSAQDWTATDSYKQYGGTITTTTVTTFAPNFQTTGYMQPWNNAPASEPAYSPAPQPQPQPQPIAIQASYSQPEVAQPAYTQPTYSQASYVQTSYAQPTYSQPTYTQAAYVQPSYSQPVYAQAAYAQPVHYRPAYQPVSYVQPVYYAQPAYVARPVVASYGYNYNVPVYRPEYRPVVASYAPVYVARPATCEVTVPQPIVTPVPQGPKVWVHEKVYVQGQPLRNLLTAVTP